MQKTAIFFFFLFAFITTAFADSIVIENQTSHPFKEPKSKIAIQWANSAKEVDEDNKALVNGSKLNLDSMQFLTRSGKVTVTIPRGAEYFRILVWSNSKGDPDLLTNWVDVIPNKLYTLEEDHLTPSVLMLGTGC